MKIINKAYEGAVEIVFDTMRHQYSVGEQVIPGCTTVLGVLSKPALLYWSANMASEYWRDNIKPGIALDEIEIERLYEKARRAHTEKKTSAGALGSFVHKWCEDYINGKPQELPVNDQLRGAVEKFLGWQKEHKVKFLLSEQLVYSQKHQYAGTTDFICVIDGKMWLGDIKTSNGIYEEYFSQTAAYLEARIEEYPSEQYEGVVIVRVGKDDGQIEVAQKSRGELKDYFDLFTNCLATYNSLQKLNPKKGVI